MSTRGRRRKYCRYEEKKNSWKRKKNNVNRIIKGGREEKKGKGGKEEWR